MTKLTLSVDPKTVAKAKRLAKESGQSVSEMFSQYIESLAARAAADVQPGRLAKKASGLIDWPDGKSDRDVLADALTARQGRGR